MSFVFPSIAEIILIVATFILAFATGSGTINVHIFGISGTFLVLFPFIAKGLVVGTFIITFLASHRTIFQHPPGIFFTFIICCPRGAVLIGVFAGQIGFHRCHHFCGFWLGGVGLACCLSIARTAVESVDLLHVHFAEAFSLTELALASFYALNGLLTVP